VARFPTVGAYVINGNFPSKFTLNSDTGVISGNATSKGNYSFTVQVTDSGTPKNTDTQQLKISIVDDK
jgi:hypothetical protein